MRRINLKGSEVAGQSVIVAIKEDGAEFGESGDIQAAFFDSKRHHFLYCFWLLRHGVSLCDLIKKEPPDLSIVKRLGGYCY